MSLEAAIEDLIGTQWFDYSVNEAAPEDATRYAVVWVPPGALSSEDVANSSDLLHVSFTVVGVGRGGTESSRVAAAVRDALVGRKPSVAGWVFGPVVMVGDPFGPVRDDDLPGVVVYETRASYEVRASRV